MRASFFISPEGVFLAISLMFGLPLIFLIRPFGAPDEIGHYFRELQLSEGQLIGTVEGKFPGGVLPTGFGPLVSLPVLSTDKVNFGEVLRDARKDAPIAWRSEAKKFFPSAALYSPGAYLPTIAAFTLSKAFALNGYQLMYLGRMANWLAVSLVFFLAIRIFPLNRWLFALLALSPMQLFLSSSVSADPLTTALTFLTLAYGTRLAVEPRGSLSAAKLAIVFLLAINLSLCKSLYFLIPWTLIPLLWDRFLERRRAIGFAVALVVATTSVFFVWSLCVRGLYIPKDPGLVSPALQLRYMMAHPLAFPRSLALTLVDSFSIFYRQAIGTLGWADIPLPDWFYVLYPASALFLWLVSSESTADKPGPWQRRTILTIGGGLTLAIFLTFYLSWTKVGLDRIDGPQGRYFLPLLPLLVIGIRRPRWIPQIPIRELELLLLVGLLSGFVTVTAVAKRSYLKGSCSWSVFSQSWRVFER